MKTNQLNFSIKREEATDEEMLLLRTHVTNIVVEESNYEGDESIDTYQSIKKTLIYADKLNVTLNDGIKTVFHCLFADVLNIRDLETQKFSDVIEWRYVTYEFNDGQFVDITDDDLFVF